MGRALQAALAVLVGVLLLFAFAPKGARRVERPHPLPSLSARTHIAQTSSTGLAARPYANAPLPSGGLPITWCGHPQPAGLLAPRSKPVFYLVYAHPADEPDHFWEFANQLQGDVSYIDRFIGAESGHTKFMRFAMGTSCGANYVSLVDWTLPRTRAAYAGARGGAAAGFASVGANFGLIDSDAASVFGAAPGVNVVMYVDGLVEVSDGSDDEGGYGDARYSNDTQPGPGNPNNEGGLMGLDMGAVGGAPAAGDEAVGPDTLLHEATHLLGAVSDAAPQSTGAGHCWVTEDLMCYADGGRRGHASDLVSVCPPRSDVMGADGGGAYDCTGDNYFNPAPAPGSYLATHYNLYNSAFMASCTEKELACGIVQPPLSATGRVRAFGRRVSLRLRAVTLQSGVVRLTAGISGVPNSAAVSVCENALDANNNSVTQGSFVGPFCTSGRGPEPPLVMRLQPADGNGWRHAWATLWLRAPHRDAVSLRVRLALP